MPTDEISNAPGKTPEKPREDRTAAAVMNDESKASRPGGGGLFGAAVNDRLGESQRTPAGTAPDHPSDTPAPEPHADGTRPEDREAELQARHRAAEGEPPEPHPSSQ
jgi:hypothetical protein